MKTAKDFIDTYVHGGFIHNFPDVNEEGRYEYAMEKYAEYIVNQRTTLQELWDEELDTLTAYIEAHKPVKQIGVRTEEEYKACLNKLAYAIKDGHNSLTLKLLWIMDEVLGQPIPKDHLPDLS